MGAKDFICLYAHGCRSPYGSYLRLSCCRARAGAVNKRAVPYTLRFSCLSFLFIKVYPYRSRYARRTLSESAKCRRSAFNLCASSSMCKVIRCNRSYEVFRRSLQVPPKYNVQSITLQHQFTTLCPQTTLSIFWSFLIYVIHSEL